MSKRLNAAHLTMIRHNKNNSILVLLIISCLVLFVNNLNVTKAQRSIHHWQKDLEFRLKLYQDQRNEIQHIIQSAIYSPELSAPQVGHNVRVISNGNIRFSELIVPTGSLIFDSPIAGPTARILVDRTQNYVRSKLGELASVQRQLEKITQQLDEGTKYHIYKGAPGYPQPQYNYSNTITGKRIFNQVQFANIVEAADTSLPTIDRTDVSRVIDETYLRSNRVRVPLDPQGRLYFEGKKTFLKTVFAGPLRSGCCDRLKPLHTNRMMLRSVNQEVYAPILLQVRPNHSLPSGGYGQPIVRITSLRTGQISNQQFALGPPSQYPSSLSPAGLNWLAPPENTIRLPNLIGLNQLGQPKALKTIVFREAVMIKEALLSNSYSDNRFVIGIGTNKITPQAPPMLQFDLSHDNYLLRYISSIRSATGGAPYEQFVTGTTVLDSYTTFQAPLDTHSVNHIGNFNRFINEIVVRLDRPTVIRGPVQFAAVPQQLIQPGGKQLYASKSMLMLQVQRSLQVGQLNGMIIPRDIVVLPRRMNDGRGDPNARVALQPQQLIRVRGPRHFASHLTVDQFVHVTGVVNKMQMPHSVIPLHLNDQVDQVGYSKLLFVDGLTLNQLTIQGGKFDEIFLRDVYVDAQSLVMNSVFPRQPGGSILVRAPLRVMNLNMFSGGRPNQGLLNGFRPNEVLELMRDQPDVLHGRKTFVGPVEALDCVFNDINGIGNWTNQLIRVDRPNTIQTIHSRLLFTNPAASRFGAPASNRSQALLAPMPPEYSLNASSSFVHIDNLEVDFQQGDKPTNYVDNWRLSPEFYLMHQALARHLAGANQTGGRYRCQQVRLLRPGAMVNKIALHDIVTLDEPFRFRNQFTIVGKVELIGQSLLRAKRVHSNYPIDKLDLVQFDKQRIPIVGGGSGGGGGAPQAPIRLANLVFSQENKASFVNARLVNGISLNEFANSIMSLTRPQTVESQLVFNAPVDFEAPVRTSSSVNGIKDFRQFAANLRQARYSFEDGLQCNSVFIRT